MEEKKVKEVVNDIKSQFQSAGVDFGFVSLEDSGVVRIELKDSCPEVPSSTGSCSPGSLSNCTSCGIPNEGIRIMIEDALKEEFPGIEKVEII